MLNETNRDEVTSDFIQWAKNALDQQINYVFMSFFQPLLADKLS